MAIYCPQCGKELPDDANFCMKCGKPLKAAAQAATQPEPRWEYCEIVFQTRTDHGFFSETGFLQFWAKGVGPSGTFTAGIVPELKGRYLPVGEPEEANAVDQLVQQLTTKGWEVLPNKGPKWYSYKFRRKIN